MEALPPHGLEMVVLLYKHRAMTVRCGPGRAFFLLFTQMVSLHQSCPAAHGTFSCRLKLHSGRIANLKMAIGCPDCLHRSWKGSAALMPPKQMVHCAPTPMRNNKLSLRNLLQ